MKRVNSLILLLYAVGLTFVLCASIEYLTLRNLQKSCVGKLPQKSEVQTGLKVKPFNKLAK